MRVIAGEAKGRELLAPKGLNTRPTLAKVKEAMFGMIQFDLEDAEVLDLFAGSGGLGIEALSRGAARSVFCDADRNAISVIKSNIKRLGYDERAEIFPGDSIALLDRFAESGRTFDIALLDRFAESGRTFDIVLLDPPYETQLESNAIAKLTQLGLLSENAILICEHSRENTPEFPDGFNVKKARKYGDCYVTYAVFEGARDQ